MMIMNGRDSAFARSGGVIGVDSFSSSSWSSSSEPSYSSWWSSSSEPLYSSSWSSSSEPSYSSSWSSSGEPSYSPSPSSSSDCWISSSTSVPSISKEKPSDSVCQLELFIIVILYLMCMVKWGLYLEAKNDFLWRTSVIKLQVGLLVPEQSLQKDLYRIATTANISTSRGWINILNRTTDSLLQHVKDCKSYYSSVDVKTSLEDAEKCFKQLSIEDRGKYHEETLVNLNNRKNQKIISQKACQFTYTYMVVTILVSAEGIIKLPIIRNNEDLEKALKML